MTDPAPARNPTRASGRAGRWWLLLPLLLLVLAALAWTGWWFWLSREVAGRLDQAQAEVNRSDYQLTWRERRIDGYPFRVRVRLEEPRFASPTGRALSAPGLVAEAVAYRPENWVVTAPQGLTIERPLTGPTRVTGRVIRASVTATDRLPRVAVEGRDLVFTPAGGAVLFPLTSAGSFDLAFQSRPEGPDEAGLLIRIGDAVAAPGTLLQRIGGDPKGRFLWESVVEKPSALRGADWESAVRNWTAAGGRMRVLQGEAAVGAAAANATGGVLTVGNDGRLRGYLDVALQRGPSALLSLRGAPKVDPAAAASAAAVVEARQQLELGGRRDDYSEPASPPEERQAQNVARIRVAFEAGVVTVGPVALAPAPKVF